MTLELFDEEIKTWDEEVMTNKRTGLHVDNCRVHLMIKGFKTLLIFFTRDCGHKAKESRSSQQFQKVHNPNYSSRISLPWMWEK